MQSDEVIKAMEKFVEDMFNIYIAAEGLRDCTEDGREKAVFNKTRGALYDLKYEARELFQKWRNEAAKQKRAQQ